MMMRGRSWAWSWAMALLLPGMLGLAACAGDDKDAPLPGERISILELQRNLEPDSEALDAQGFIAPEAWENEFWPQAGGYPSHSMQHLALGAGELKREWSVSVGKGATRFIPLTAQPIVVDGRVFTVDSEGRLSAFAIADGKRLWDVSLRRKGEGDAAIGGGVSYSRGQLYATTGYSELVALSPADGGVIWRRDIPAPSRAAPTILDDRVFVTTLDNRILALGAAAGEMLWEYAGIGENTTLLGSAAPAAERDIVVPAFSSGELYALHVGNGAVAWSESLTSLRSLGGLGSLSDIRGLPVIDKGLVIAVSFGGRLIAIDARTGNRAWQRDIGSAVTPWIAGNHLFVVSTQNELVALGRDTGAIRWVRQLPRFKDGKDRSGAIFWTAPVLAGGRLIVAGTDGGVWEVAPEDGSVVRTWSTGRSVTIPPLVAGGRLYLLADDGTLTAYR